MSAGDERSPAVGVNTGLARFTANLRASPRSFATSFYRSGTPRTDRSRSSFIFSSLFLHFHSVRVHRWALRWSTTLGLGVISISAFLITLVTGVLLMFYYKPYPSAAYDSINGHPLRGADRESLPGARGKFSSGLITYGRRGRQASPGLAWGSRL